MSAEFEAAVDKVRARVSDNPPEGVFKFEIADQGVIRIVDGVVETGDGEADVTVRSDLDTFKQMFGGELSPAAAFMAGRVEVDGDMSMAMRLSALVE